MTLLDRPVIPVPPVIWVGHWDAAGAGLGSQGCNGNSATTPNWTANRIQYIPFYLGAQGTAYQMFCLNGTVAGNLDMGIYDAAGNRVVNKGSTAMAGASQIQLLDITDTALDPGNYWMAFWGDSGSATFRGLSGGTETMMALGLMTETNASGLPATATMTRTIISRCIFMGISFRSFF